ncbi:MAG: flagellar basal body P-ring formation chaperone FlgA [Pseudomonadota bacterium]
MMPMRAVILALAAHVLVLSAMALPARGAEQAVRAARLLPPGTVLAAADLTVMNAGDHASPSLLRPLVGMRLRHAIAAGAAIGPRDVARPYVIERNRLVVMRYLAGGLVIRTEGRALGSAALGERVSVMNLTSKETVTAIATGAGSVEIRR